MITVLQIVFFCLLLSAFFFTGIITILITGIFNLGEIISIFPQQVQGLILAAVFLILFSIIFFYINVRQHFVEKEKEEYNISYLPESIDLAADETEVAEVEVIEEEVSCSPESADLVADEIEIAEVAVAEEEVSCMPESINIVVDETEVVKVEVNEEEVSCTPDSIDEEVSCMPEFIDIVVDETEVVKVEVIEEKVFCMPESADFAANETEIAELEVVELEDISAGSGGNVSIIMGRLFTFSPGNPELLQVVENSTTGISGKVIYERNGIHYINRDAFANDGNTEREIDNDFAKLVESVVN